jgi:hypothetical protein
MTPSAQPINSRRLSLRYAAWGAVWLTLIQLGWRQLQPGADLDRTWAMATPSTSRRDAFQELGCFEQIVRETAPGNVRLHLAGAAQTDAALEKPVSYVYYRFAYLLYPRRIFAGTADCIINNGNEVMRSQFRPTPSWLQEHDVRNVLFYGNDKPDEGIRLQILPSDEDPSAGQASPKGGN